LESISLH
jgi:hypothetical protein